MKRIYYLTLALMLSLLPGLTSCVDENETPHIPKDGSLSLNYRIDGAEEIETYAKPAEQHEREVGEVYTLFFRAASHAAANTYVGYTRTGVSQNTATGNARVTLPDGESVDDEWQLIFLANFDRYAFLDGENSVADFFDNKVATKSFADAKAYLKAYYVDKTGIKAPLPMSSSFTKAANTNVASITFKRRVARIDLVNNSTTQFILESAQVWNARARGHMLDEGGTFVSDANFLNYDQQVVKANGATSILAKLYAMPNHVMVPTIQDHETTCLIIGGKYNGSATTTYYRVNVSSPTGAQNVRANGAYTINITNVTDAGETDPGEAYDKTQLKMDYTINEWDDDFLGTYIFDEHGNGLAVSQRNVIFSDKGNQEVQLEVFTILSASNPISGSWTVGAPAGADATFFESSKVASPADRYIIVKAIADNETTADREATATVSWGTINLPVKLTQLNPTSQIGGIKLQPSDLWFMMAGDTKEICVNLQGNFTGVSRSDIKHSVLYEGSNTGWLTLTNGATPDDAAAGLYYFNVTAANNTSSILRKADLKFVVKQGSLIASAQAHVIQSLTSPTDPFERQLKVVMLELNNSGTYEEKGIVASIYNNIVGLPDGQSGKNHLHFAIAEHQAIKYHLEIQSSQAWKIVPVGYAGQGLVFSKMSDTGDAATQKTIEILPAGDVGAGWSGGFTIEYEDGDKAEFITHQTGVLGTLPDDNKIYYYGTFNMNGKMWLDRELGATIGMTVKDGYYTKGFASSEPGNYKYARGKYSLEKNYNTDFRNHCPRGFALPTVADAEYIKKHVIISSNTNETLEPEHKTPFVLYVPLSSNPVRTFRMNTGGNLAHGTKGVPWSNQPNNTTGLQGGDNAGNIGTYIPLDTDPTDQTVEGHVLAIVWIHSASGVQTYGHKAAVLKWNTSLDSHGAGTAYYQERTWGITGDWGQWHIATVVYINGDRLNTGPLQIRCVRK